MKKIFYDKLIRDKVPANIVAKGSSLEYRLMKKTEFECELLRKLIEESFEVSQAESKKELVSELADLSIIIEELQKLKKISDPELDMAIKESLHNKGGFNNRVFLIWSSDIAYAQRSKRSKK